MTRFPNKLPGAPVFGLAAMLLAASLCQAETYTMIGSARIQDGDEQGAGKRAAFNASRDLVKALFADFLSPRIDDSSLEFFYGYDAATLYNEVFDDMAQRVLARQEPTYRCAEGECVATAVSELDTADLATELLAGVKARAGKSLKRPAIALQVSVTNSADASHTGNADSFRDTLSSSLAEQLRGDDFTIAPRGAFNVALDLSIASTENNSFGRAYFSHAIGGEIRVARSGGEVIWSQPIEHRFQSMSYVEMAAAIGRGDIYRDFRDGVLEAWLAEFDAPTDVVVEVRGSNAALFVGEISQMLDRMLVGVQQVKVEPATSDERARLSVRYLGWHGYLRDEVAAMLETNRFTGLRAPEYEGDILVLSLD